MKINSKTWDIGEVFQSKVAENSDQQKNLAFKRIMDDVMSKQRKQELELYRLYAKYDAFYQAFLIP